MNNEAIVRSHHGRSPKISYRVRPGFIQWIVTTDQYTSTAISMTIDAAGDPVVAYWDGGRQLTRVATRRAQVSFSNVLTSRYTSEARRSPMPSRRSPSSSPKATCSAPPKPSSRRREPRG